MSRHPRRMVERVEHAVNVVCAVLLIAFALGLFVGWFGR